MSIISIGKSIPQHAADWVAKYDTIRNPWIGTRTDLEIELQKAYDACGNYVHTRNPLYNTKNGRQACKNALLVKHGASVDEAIFDSYNDELSVKKAVFEGSAKLYGTIGVVLAVLLIAAVLLRK